MTALSERRRGACPALSAPMQTGDGLLVRLRPVSQGLTPKQLIGLCESAARHGNGLIEITARGSIQIRGLTPVSVADLAADVDALDIEVQTGVPVETGPLAGLDPEEIADPRPLADSIRASIKSAGLAARLGPKVSVVVHGGGRFGLDSVPADIRLQAAGRRGRTVWRLALAGDAHTAESLGATLVTGAVDFVMDLLSEIAALGVEARGRDLKAGGAQSQRPAILSPKLPAAQTPGLGPIPLDASVALAIALPFGSIDAGTLIAFAHEAERHGATELRPAPARTLIVLGLDAATAASLQAAAATLGFVVDSADPRAAVAACSGAPACASGRIETRAIATDIANTMPELLQRVGDLHVSGCAKGCAHPAAAAITLVGDENGVGLVVNGTARQKPLAYTQREALKASLKRLALLMSEHSGDEIMGAGPSRPSADRLAAAFRQDF